MPQPDTEKESRDGDSFSISVYIRVEQPHLPVRVRLQ